jgi:hypothetical protein
MQICAVRYSKRLPYVERGKNIKIHIADLNLKKYAGKKSHIAKPLKGQLHEIFAQSELEKSTILQCLL